MLPLEAATSENRDSRITTNGFKDGLTLPDNYPTVLQKYTSCRWRLAYLLGVSCILAQSVEYCMNFAVVCMTRGITLEVGYDPTDTDEHHSNSSIIHSTRSPNTTNITEIIKGEFDYSSEIQGLLISSPFYTSIISSCVGSIASRRFGAKIVIFLGVLTFGTMTVLIPLAARTQLYLAVICRLCVGFCNGLLIPASFDLWLQWSPSHETQQIVAFCFAGYSVATIVTFSLCGFLCMIPVDNGWPFIFYVFGGCAVLWSPAWMYIATNTPETYAGISREEMAYIKTRRTGSDSHKDREVPWLAIARSKAFWAYITIMSSHNLNSTILFSYLPLYMDTVLHFDFDENGLLSSLPSVTRLLGTLIWSHISIRLQRVTSLSITRKSIQTAGFLVAAVLTAGLCNLREGQEYIAVTLFAGVTMFHSATVVAGIVNPVDLAPQYASYISSAGMTSAFTAMAVGPTVVSYMIQERTREQWATVFYSSAAVYVIAALLFVIFGSGEIQPWAKNSDKITDLEIPESRTQSEVNTAYVGDMEGAGAVLGSPDK